MTETRTAQADVAHQQFRGRRAALLTAAWGCLAIAGPGRAAQVAPSVPLQHGLVLRPEHGTEGFPFVFHDPSGRWVGQELQLAVPAARPLPDPLVVPGQEDRMQILLFGRLTIESAAVVGGVGNRQVLTLPNRDDWVWWWVNKPMGDVELRRPQRLGVQLRWPPVLAGAPVPGPEPMEVFDLPPIDALPPQQWTRWQRAAVVVDGPDAQFQVARGRIVTKPAAPPALPFELRSRAALWDTPLRPRKA